MGEETSAHILCECKALASLRHAYLGSFFLEPEDIRILGLGAIWSYSKAAGLPWFDMGHKGPVLIKAQVHRDWEAPNPNANQSINQSIKPTRSSDVATESHMRPFISVQYHKLHALLQQVLWWFCFELCHREHTLLLQSSSLTSDTSQMATTISQIVYQCYGVAAYQLCHTTRFLLQGQTVPYYWGAYPRKTQYKNSPPCKLLLLEAYTLHPGNTCP